MSKRGIFSCVPPDALGKRKSITAAEARYILKGGPKPGAPVAVEPKRSKYGNKTCTDAEGRKFGSHLERNVYQRLVAQGRNIICQVSLPLAGGRRMQLDFMEIVETRDDGTFVGRLIDAKGRESKEWPVKAAWLRDKHGLHIELVKK